MIDIIARLTRVIEPHKLISLVLLQQFPARWVESGHTCIVNHNQSQRRSSVQYIWFNR